MNMTFASAFMRHGQRDLQLVAMAYGLPGPTQEMVNLLDQQNLEIEEAIKEHGSYWDMELKRQIYQISRAWNMKIVAAAKSARIWINRKIVEDTRRQGLLWFPLLIVFAIACLCGLAFWIVPPKLRRLARSEANAPDSGSPQEAKPDIVVGRPVANEPDVENVSAGVVGGVLLGRISNSKKATE